MIITKTKLDDCLIIEPAVFEDSRGFFSEVFNKKNYKKNAGIEYEFVQDNYSRSKKNTLRGLHFQKNNPQGKLVRVVRGEVFDVAVDLRANSKNLGCWEGVILNETNKKQFWIPPGFAHGFLVLSEYADFEYKCTNYYYPNDEVTLMWNDPDVNIKWPCASPHLSEKDKNGSLLKNITK